MRYRDWETQNALQDAKIRIEQLQRKFITMDRKHDILQMQVVRTLGRIEDALNVLPPLSQNIVKNIQ